MFITVEGMEGSGKTTQMGYIREFFYKNRIETVITREPGGTPIGEHIRAILLNPSSRDLNPFSELMLYFADRVQHVETVIRPALAAGRTVVCDRYFDATLVYQGYARGLDIGLIRELHRMLLGGFSPDLTLLLDLPVKVGLSRAWKRIQDYGESGESRFENEALKFHERVREGYLELARLEPDRFRIVDASGNEDHVREVVFDTLSGVMKLQNSSQ